MTWFAVYETATSRLRSVGTEIPSPLPVGLSSKDVGTTRPDGVWNTSTQSFDPRPPRRQFTVLALLRRFTRAERNAFRASADAAVSDFLFLLTLDDDVNVDDPALGNALDMLETKGILGPGRSDEIKGPFA